MESYRDGCARELNVGSAPATRTCPVSGAHIQQHQPSPSLLGAGPPGCVDPVHVSRPKGTWGCARRDMLSQG